MQVDITRSDWGQNKKQDRPDACSAPLFFRCFPFIFYFHRRRWLSADQVGEYCVVVDRGAESNQNVPDGVRQRYSAVALEEHDTDDV